MLSSEEGSETLLRFVHSEKASVPIFVTVDGNETEVISVLPSNALEPTAVTVWLPIFEGIATLPPLPVYSLITPDEMPYTSEADVVVAFIVVVGFLVARVVSFFVVVGLAVVTGFVVVGAVVEGAVVVGFDVDGAVVVGAAVVF